MEKLKILHCSRCPNLTKIPVLKSLQFLNCMYCPRLTEVLSFPLDIFLHSSPFLIQNSEYTENVSKLIKLQKFAKKYVKYIRIKHYIKSREFAEWFYDPKNFGGYKTKQRLNKFSTSFST